MYCMKFLVGLPDSKTAFTLILFDRGEILVVNSGTVVEQI